MKFTEANGDDLTEQTPFTKELSESEFLTAMRERARNSHLIAKKLPFFRQDDGPDYQLITPRAKNDISAFWINKLISEHQGWRRFPSRTKFISAYTNFSRTFGGDDVYVLLPLDRTRVGFASSHSFYRSFKNLSKTLGTEKADNQALIEWLMAIKTNLSKLTNTKLKISSPTNYNEFRNGIKKLDRLMAKEHLLIRKNLTRLEKLTDDEKKLTKNFIDRHITTTENYLEELLNPEDNGFQVLVIESISHQSTDQEIWIDSPALLIKRTAYVKLHKKGTIQ